MYKTIDGNEAIVLNAYNFSELCGIYPITPASPMAEKIDVLSNCGKLNYFDNKVEVVEMQSEAGAIALVHGALQSGVLASTFTASQGLLLMIPTLYKLAGEMLPSVIHVAARSISTHALSIFGDHQDIYSVRMTGVCILASSSVFEAYCNSAVAHLSAISAMLPFVHFVDGFRTSHEINKIKVIDDNEFKKLIDIDKLYEFKKKAISITNPNTRGTAQNDDIYFQNTEVRNNDYMKVSEIVSNYMKKVSKLTGSNIDIMNYYGANDACNIIIAMGSIGQTIRETVDDLNKKGRKYGVIVVHLYRPFDKEFLRSILPESVKQIAVLDRTKEAGSSGEPLYLDVVEALFKMNVKIYGGRYGLSSKNTTPGDIFSVFNYMDSNKLFNNFTIGINDDVTNLSLISEDYEIDDNTLEYLIYGYGSDGMVSTSKDLIKIIGDNTDNYVQGYFQYDSKKSGGVTRSHIRVSKDEIRKPYYVDKPKLIVVSKDEYIYKYDVLSNMKDEGILLLNTSLNNDELVSSLPNEVKYLLAKKNIKFYVIDATKLVNDLGLKNKISTCMETCIFKIINIIEINNVKKILKEQNSKRFKHKGEEVISVNNDVVDNALFGLKEVMVDKEWVNLNTSVVEKEKTFEEVINYLKGDSLPVSAFLDKKDGVVLGGNTKKEKRKIASVVPRWISEKCIECNLCSYVCPHAVIRPFLVSNGGISSLMPKGINYKIGISYEDCTGCGLCAKTCPGKNGEKALEMKNYDKDVFKENEFLDLLRNNKNELAFNLPNNARNLQFKMPRFEFNGACAGCGEATYLKNLTQLFGDNLVIANATGCSSIYGASSPSTPYSIPWASSLFEDNSEYGLGIMKGFEIQRKKVKNYLNSIKDSVVIEDRKLFDNLLENFDNYQECKKIVDVLDYEKYPYLFKYKDALLPKKMFIVGGDGFAYDIGFGGLDHVLSTDNDINILILDTEVYSNTGGQSSKSSNIGSVASFTSSGKVNYKKDLVKMAMCYPHVYVACVNIGYDKNQYIQVLKEASEYKGPSLIIAYSPCIEHGLKVGMEHSLENAYLATKCGYFLTFRYNPLTKEFKLDSKDVDFNKYNEFLKTQNRYRVDDEELLLKQKEWAKERFNYYSKL